MKTTILNIVVSFLIFLYACGGSEKKSQYAPNQSSESGSATASEPKTLAEAEKNWKNDNGVGPVSSLELPGEIDQALADKGKEIYQNKCTACHKPDKKFIGPAPVGILERRTPSWIMNMILNPENMIQNDPIAKQLLIEFNGSPMANQNLTEEEARAVLEYFRTL